MDDKTLFNRFAYHNSGRTYTPGFRWDLGLIIPKPIDMYDTISISADLSKPRYQIKVYEAHIRSRKLGNKKPRGPRNKQALAVIEEYTTDDRV